MDELELKTASKADKQGLGHAENNQQSHCGWEGTTNLAEILKREMRCMAVGLQSIKDN
jgi:hypothetical protein